MITQALQTRQLAHACTTNNSQFESANTASQALAPANSSPSNVCGGAGARVESFLVFEGGEGAAPAWNRWKLFFLVFWGKLEEDFGCVKFCGGKGLGQWDCAF